MRSSRYGVPAALRSESRYPSHRAPRVLRAAVSFELSLRAENKSPRTIAGHAEGVRQFAEWLADVDPEATPGTVSRARVRQFLEHLIATRSASTARNRYSALRQFFRWAVNEGEIDPSPMR